jgi:hypothetical protein
MTVILRLKFTPLGKSAQLTRITIALVGIAMAAWHRAIFTLSPGLAQLKSDRLGILGHDG